MLKNFYVLILINMYNDENLKNIVKIANVIYLHLI